jgi:hypothetical protein
MMSCKRIRLVVKDSADESSYVPVLEAAGYVLQIREPDWFEHRLFKGPDMSTEQKLIFEQMGGYYEEKLRSQLLGRGYYMKFGETEIVRKEGNVCLLKIGCRGDREAFCVIGDGSTQHYDDYEDALDEFNMRWMKAKFGE